MGRRIALILCIIGVLVSTSMVKSQDSRGTPGVDYPNYFTIPETSFKCSDQKYNPGFYADLETKCQAFHFCYQDRQESFLCPTGTIFNQAVLTCDVWYNSNCSLAQSFYSVNSGPIMERAGKNLPMLLRWRNRSRTKPVQSVAANVLDKVSPMPETTNEAPVENLSTSQNKLKTKIGDESVSNSVTDVNKDDEQMISDSHEGKSEIDADKDIRDTVDEEMDLNLVYEPASHKNHEQYESKWQDTEQTEFNRFYGYQDPYEYKADERESYFENNFNQNEDSTMNDYPEFTKRASQAGRSTFRRKPVYVVLDDQSEIQNAAAINRESDILVKNEDKEMNLADEPVEESTPSPEPFPRPTAIPHHLLNISTEVPMTSEEFGAAIFSELVEPYLPDDYGVVLASTYPQVNESTSNQSEQTGSQTSDTQSDDETIYIENDVEPDSYVPYVSRYEDVIIPGEQSYVESPEQVDADDTFLVIPDEYDDSAVDSSSEDYFEISDYPEETAYRTQMLADRSSVAGYGAYETSYRYSPMDYPNYESANYNPEIPTGMYQNLEPSDQRYAYERDYEFPGEPMNYETSNFDENSYGRAEFHPYERPARLPVNQVDLEIADPDRDLIEDVEHAPGQSEDVYYVLDLDEEKPNENETEMESEKSELNDASSAEKSKPLEKRNHEIKNTNSASDEYALKASVSLGNEGKMFESPKTDVDNVYSSKFANPDAQMKTMDNAMSSDTVSISSGPKEDQSSESPSLDYDNLSTRKTPAFSNMGDFDFASDSGLLNNMAYAESMDFGPYGVGPNMGQFGMMESMQRNTAGNPFAQRMSQTEQKVSPLSAIQEKMRSMKQGKFGAFKKYMSSTSK